MDYGGREQARPNTVREVSMGGWLALVIVALAVVLVVAYVVRQSRRVRRLQEQIDYNRVQRWDDEEDETQH